MAHITPHNKATQMAIDPKERPKYDTEQLHKYFKRIYLPQEYLDSPVLSASALARTKEHGLPLLNALTRYHACNVPFENLELHYSTHKTISLDMNDLYTKFAECGIQYGRGGRCMENNGFFGTVLRSLNFEVRNCAGRVSRAMSPDAEIREQQSQTYDGWNHMLNLVRLDRQWYVVDVGMGAMGPHTPYPLEDGYEAVSIAPRRIRLQWRSIPEQAVESGNAAQKLWCYDVCNRPTAEKPEDNHWSPTYCFTETEFLPQDYEMMSWFTSTSRKSFFTYSVLCTKMVLDEASEKIIGDITLFGNAVRKTVGGQREVLRECKSEQERVEALKEIFGVELTPEEARSISSAVKVQ